MNGDGSVAIEDGKKDVENKGPACVDEWIPKVKWEFHFKGFIIMCGLLHFLESLKYLNFINFDIL